MERVFSVDDILGTFWKLETQSDQTNTTGAVSGTGVPVNGGNAYNPNSGMSRSSSEWAFQEFLKEGSGLQSRSDSQVFVISEEEGEEENDADYPLSHENRKDEEQKQPDGVSIPGLKEEVEESSYSKLNQETSDVLEQPELKMAVNPLFSGLHDEVPTAPPQSDSEEYEHFLKQRLDHACAVAMTRVNGLGSAKITSNMSLQQGKGSSTSGLLGADVVANEAHLKGHVGIPAPPPKPDGVSFITSSKPATSGSSREQSDDEDENDGVVNDQNLEPGDMKRVKRMLSNRESARRSRRRKQAHLSELETQVAQLRVENTNLVKSLTDISQKFSEASVDNRVLKSDVEALATKVKMAEGLVSRATGQPVGQPPLIPGSHGTSRTFAYSPGPFGAAHVPTTQGYVHHGQPPSSQAFPGDRSNVDHALHPTGQQGPSVKMGRTPSMQRVASLEHLQKRIRGGGVPGSSMSTWGAEWDMDVPSMAEQSSVSSD